MVTAFLLWKEKSNRHRYVKCLLPDSGSELRSPQSISGTLLQSRFVASGLRLSCASLRMLWSLCISIIVWINLTSQNSGSQCTWQVATSNACFTWPSGGTPMYSKKIRCSSTFRLNQYETFHLITTDWLLCLCDLSKNRYRLTFLSTDLWSAQMVYQKSIILAPHKIRIY